MSRDLVIMLWFSLPKFSASGGPYKAGGKGHGRPASGCHEQTSRVVCSPSLWWYSFAARSGNRYYHDLAWPILAIVWCHCFKKKKFYFLFFLTTVVPGPSLQSRGERQGVGVNGDNPACSREWCTGQVLWTQLASSKGATSSFLYIFGHTDGKRDVYSINN